MNQIKVSKLTNKARIPTRKFPNDAGMDLYASTGAVIYPFSFKIVNTGVTIEVPKGYVAQIWPKSRSNFLIGGGIIDENYQGEVLVKIANLEKCVLNIAEGDAIGQIVLVPVITPEITEVSKDDIHQSKTSRGSAGGIVSQLEMNLATGRSQMEFISEPE